MLKIILFLEELKVINKIILALNKQKKPDAHTADDPVGLGIPWIAAGKSVIFPSLQKSWQKCFNSNAMTCLHKSPSLENFCLYGHEQLANMIPENIIVIS